MLSRIRARLTYSNVTATVALFVALGGAAYAIETAPRNSVVSKSIKNGQVKLADTSDKLRLKCPSDTRFHEGACIETSSRSAAIYNTASSTCEALPGRLPSREELDSFRHEPGITLAGGEGEWTSTSYNDEEDGGTLAFRVLAVGESGPGIAANGFVNHAFRCVLAPRG